MALTILLCAFLLSLGLLSHGKAEALKQDTSSDFLDTCNQIAAAISDASQVFSRGEHVILSFLMIQADGRSRFIWLFI